MFGFASCSFLNSSYLLSAANMEKFQAVAPSVETHVRYKYINMCGNTHISINALANTKKINE